MFIYKFPNTCFWSATPIRNAFGIQRGMGVGWKKTPYILVGYSELPHQEGPAGPLFQTLQDVAPKTHNGKTPMYYGIKGITWSISGKKEILSLTSQFPFEDHMLCYFVTWQSPWGPWCFCLCSTLWFLCDYMIICVLYNHTVALTLVLHHLWWKCHSWVLSIPLLSKIKIPSFSIQKVSSCRAAGCTQRLSNRCFN